MKDDGTRTRFPGSGEGNDDKGPDSNLVRVRTGSGKIYGPYTRAEIVQFIYQKKLKGEESILIGQSTQWRALSSDTEFFDALQNALLGKKPPVVKAKKEITKVVVQDNSEPATKVSSKQKTKADVSQTKLTEVLLRQDEAEALPTEEKREEAAGPLRLLDEQEPSKQKPPRSGAPIYTPPHVFEQPAPPENSRSLKMSPKIKGVLFLIVAVTLVLVFLPKSNTGPASSLYTPTKWGIVNDKKYFYNLNQNIQLLETDLVSFPEWDNLSTSTDTNHLGGFGAHQWIERLNNLDKLAQKNPVVRNAASFWEAKAWGLMWLSSVLQPVDNKKSVAVKVYAEKIVGELVSRNKISAEAKKTFEAQKLFVEGRFKDVLALDSSHSSEVLDWLKEEVSWLLFWDGGDAYSAAKQTHDSGETDLVYGLTSKIRASLFGQKRDVPVLVMQLASVDPYQYHLWFSFAQYNWRIDSRGIEYANRLFQTGLSVLSMYPLSVQQLYWKQYGEYLLKFGREALVKNVRGNLSALSQLSLSEKSFVWWDVGSEDLDLNRIAETTHARLLSTKFDFVDIATAFVLGGLANQGEKLLNLVGMHWAFEKEWEKAKNVYERALRIKKDSVDVLGGLIWVYASQYKFDLAFSTYDQLKSFGSGAEEEKKYLGIIHWMGREYLEARKYLNEFITEYPNDSLAHYILAKVHESMQKNNDCMKAASLSRVHGRGELRFRASLLFYRCSIKSKVAVKKSLQELDALHNQDPQNIPVTLERIDGYMNANLSAEALQISREAVENFPWSYALRLKLGDVYAFKGDYDRAVAFYNDASTYRKNSGEALVRLSEVLDKQKKFLEAARNLSVAAKIDPGYPDIFLLAGRAWDKAGRPEQAVEYYVNEVKERPSALGSFLEVVEFLLKNNAPQEVPKVYALFSAEFREDPRVQTRLAQAYLAMGDYEKAKISAASAMSTDANIPEPHLVMGFVYEQMGQYDMAKNSFERYLVLFEAAPDAAEIRAKLSRHPYQ